MNSKCGVRSKTKRESHDVQPTNRPPLAAVRHCATPFVARFLIHRMPCRLQQNATAAVAITSSGRTVSRRGMSTSEEVGLNVSPTLRAPLSGTFLQTLPDLVMPLKGHSLSPRSCPATRSTPSERFGY